MLRLLLFFVALGLVACPPPTSPVGVEPEAGDMDAGLDGGSEWPGDGGGITITPHESWKTRLTLPGDPFAASTAQLQWVKFTVLKADPTRVYYQNSRTYPLHAPFAIERLDPFMGMTVAQFEQVSLHVAGQQAITGAVLIGPSVVKEIGVQLVSLDAYPKETVKKIFDLVKASIDAPSGLGAFYMPTFEQLSSTQQNLSWFEGNGVPVSSAQRWVHDSLCYSTGWALGRLVHVAPQEIEAAYADGRLTINDVLVTEQVPVEVPPVAGIIALEPATPNSHVAILATTLGIPFLYTPQASHRASLTALNGKEVLLRASSFLDTCSLDVFDASAMSPSVRAELLALKVPQAIAFPPKQVRGAYSANTDALLPADLRYFGGKAAHYGLLRRAIPNDSYRAAALSFDVWDDVMAQEIAPGQTLRTEIDSRLAPVSTWPPNLATVKQTLQGIRQLVEASAQFSPAAQAGIRAALGGFDAQTNLRFRSSTNVEDTDNFTGAGLYDSATGCLADDDDQDAVGPSLCNSNRADERGAFLALRRVFASFYNDNAYLERLRRRVNEAQVGMAVLVHPSVPDDDELANGVATFTPLEFSNSVHIVTQLGADSVTNPTSGALPEVVNGSGRAGRWYIDFVSASSRVPLGTWVMKEPDDYQTLGRLMALVGEEYALTRAPPFSLDFEFKRQIPDKIWLKQVRPLPVPDSTPNVVPYVLNRSQKLCVLQGESSDVVSLHRNRARLTPVLRDVRLTEQERGQSLFASVSVELFEGDALETISRAPVAHTQMMDAMINSFAWGSRAVDLSVQVPRLIRSDQSPVLTTKELQLSLEVTWSEPQITATIGTTTFKDFVRLTSCPADEALTPQHTRQERVFTRGDLSIRTSYWWPPTPPGASAGYTAPLAKWESTDITGLTTAPIQLTEDFAQTYRPEHHNFSENFLFDPTRDPRTTASQRAELIAHDVKWLIVSGTADNATFSAVGFDGQIRVLP